VWWISVIVLVTRLVFTYSKFESHFIANANNVNLVLSSQLMKFVWYFENLVTTHQQTSLEKDIASVTAHNWRDLSAVWRQHAHSLVNWPVFESSFKKGLNFYHCCLKRCNYWFLTSNYRVILVLDCVFCTGRELVTWCEEV